MKKRYIVLVTILIIIGYFPVKSMIVGRTTPNQYEENYVNLASYIRSPLICEKINKNVYKSNSWDHFTYYLKSRCYQELAGVTRDEKYCDKVIERKSFSPMVDGSSWSLASCIEGVEGGKLSDYRTSLGSSLKIEHTPIEHTANTKGIILGAMGYSREEIDSEKKDFPSADSNFSFFLNHYKDQEFINRALNLPDFSK